jgi:hypothetical protein
MHVDSGVFGNAIIARSPISLPPMQFEEIPAGRTGVRTEPIAEWIDFSFLIAQGQTPWSDWSNFTLYTKRKILDNTSYMSSDDFFFFWPRYAILSQEQKNWVWKAIDFNALPVNVDPFRDGPH